MFERVRVCAITATMTIKKKSAREREREKKTDDRDRMSYICTIYFCWLSLTLRTIFNLMNDLSTTIQASTELALLPDRNIRRHPYCITHCSHWCHRSGQWQYFYCTKKKEGRTFSSLYCITIHIHSSILACHFVSFLLVFVKMSIRVFF